AAFFGLSPHLAAVTPPPARCWPLFPDITPSASPDSRHAAAVSIHSSLLTPHLSLLTPHFSLLTPPPPPTPAWPATGAAPPPPACSSACSRDPPRPLRPGAIPTPKTRRARARRASFRRPPRRGASGGRG